MRPYLSMEVEDVDGQVISSLEGVGVTLSKEYVRGELDNAWKHFKRGQQLWSFAHHFSLFGGAVLAFLTTVLILTEAGKRSEGIAAGMATLLTSIASLGGFARKWRSARLSRGALEGLRWDVEKDDADLGEILDKLKKISEGHDLFVVGLADDERRA